MIETSVYATLQGLVGGRCYPLIAPDSPTAPFIVYQSISSAPENTLSSGVPINNARIQVDAYDKTYAAAKTLAESAKAAMAAAAFTNVQLMEQDLYEPEVKLFRCQMDFSIWY